MGWLVCDGQEVSRTTYAALYEAIGDRWGAGDGTTTFNVPPLQNRYRRHRDDSTVAGAVGNLQTSQNKTHQHPVTGSTGNDTPDHSHHMDFTSQDSGSLDHTHGGGAVFSTFTSGGFVNVGSANGLTYGGPANTGGADRTLAHGHRILGDTGGASARHAHAINFTSGDDTGGGAEARPLSATVLTCIKT
mgnify:CR=1 FL=1